MAFSEFGWQKLDAWHVLSPVAVEAGAWVLFCSTPNGRNHFWEMFERHRSDPAWFVSRLTIADTRRDAAGEDGSPVITPAAVAEEIRSGMSEELADQEYYCKAVAGLSGSILGKVMDQARRDNRVGHVPHHPGAEVHTSWDFGFRDLTAIWFVQRVGVAYHVIEFFQASGLTVADFADVLKEKKHAHGYSYGTHYAPHDALQDNIQTGRSIADTAATEAGLFFEVVQRGSVAAGINAMRQLIPQCWFDEAKCAEGIEALERYAYDWNPELQAFSLKPAHSRWSHACDALRTFATGYQDIPADYTVRPVPAILDFDVFTGRPKGPRPEAAGPWDDAIKRSMGR